MRVGRRRVASQGVAGGSVYSVPRASPSGISAIWRYWDSTAAHASAAPPADQQTTLIMSGSRPRHRANDAAPGSPPKSTRNAENGGGSSPPLGHSAAQAARSWSSRSRVTSVTCPVLRVTWVIICASASQLFVAPARMSRRCLFRGPERRRGPAGRSISRRSSWGRPPSVVGRRRGAPRPFWMVFSSWSWLPLSPGLKKYSTIHLRAMNHCVLFHS